ncbi:hypothetical protein WJX72_009246 [[Myrmecia] bisecta]|uniref:Uncharacterized protein n=1 Tax=[Myrmecia] bisecta TaxID=41462 RepID=A0AAW1Q621_9CHLO
MNKTAEPSAAGITFLDHANRGSRQSEYLWEEPCLGSASCWATSPRTVGSKQADCSLATSCFHRQCLSPADVSQARTMSCAKPTLLYCRHPAGTCSTPTAKALRSADNAYRGCCGLRLRRLVSGGRTMDMSAGSGTIQQHLCARRLP